MPSVDFSTQYRRARLHILRNILTKFSYLLLLIFLILISFLIQNQRLYLEIYGRWPKITDFSAFLDIKNIQYVSLYFEFKSQFYLFGILFMTSNLLTILIWVSRNFETSEYFFLARVNCRAKKQLTFCDMLSPVSVNS